MRALLWLDAGAGTVAGQTVQGHIVQAERTAEALRVLGVDAIISTNEGQELRGFDVVHAIGARRPLLRKARQLQVPVAISTIYWSKAYTTGAQAQSLGVREWARTSNRRARVASSVLRRGGAATAQVLMQPLFERALDFECADLLLPNSTGEAEAIARELGTTTPAHVVVNGVDPVTFYPPEAPSERDIVLAVGRIEPHKNQLGLIQALRVTGLPLVIVGPPHPHHMDYYEACRRAAGAAVAFERARSHDELRQFYQRARVHVLASWFETTGLVSLEAALCGAHVATTNRGHAREYFADLAQYLDPADPDSIADAVRRAWDIPPSAELAARVRSRYTWRHVAEATRQAYDRLRAGDHTAEPS